MNRVENSSLYLWKQLLAFSMCDSVEELKLMFPLMFATFVWKREHESAEIEEVFKSFLSGNATEYKYTSYSPAFKNKTSIISKCASSMKGKSSIIN